MATYYIDPTAATNGNGTIDSPYNTWGSVNFSSGNLYLQKQGSVFNGKVVVSSGGVDENSRVILSVYGPQVIPLKSGLAQQKAKINANGFDRAMQVSINANFVTIDNFELYGANTKSLSVRGVAIGSTATNRADNVTIQNCIIRDIGSTVTLPEDENGIQCFGDNFRLLNSEIYNIADDGVWVQGNYFEAGYVNIHHVAMSNRVAGDCIQMSNTAGVSSDYWIHHCNLDHSNVEMKQCFIDAVGYGGSTGGIFEFNTCVMAMDNFQPDASKTVNIGNPNSLIRSNDITGGWAAIWALGDNSKCYSNKIKQFKKVGVNVYAGTTGITVANNSLYSSRSDKIVGCRAIDVASTVVSSKIYNNAASGSGIDYVITCSKVGATSNGVDIKNNKGLGVTAFQSVNGGVDASNVSIDPDWDLNTLAPNPTSPLIGGGYRYWGTDARPLDINEEPISDDFIDIGAIQSRFHQFHPANL